MRWWSLPIGLALCWFVFTLTPLWALYDLAQAVRAGDAAYVEHHVNFRTLRLSLLRQATGALRTGPEATGGTEPRERIADAAAVLVLPLVEALITPGTVIDLLDDGWPQSLDLGRDAEPAADKEGDLGTDVGRGLRVDSVGKLVPFYLASEMRGFRTVVMTVPPGSGAARRLRIRLRLRGWTWRLVDIELPEDLRQRIAQSLTQATAQRPRSAKP